MGYFDIPFDFCCPKCGVHIHGTRYLTDKRLLDLNNAEIVECSLDEMEYYADFSVELPHKKLGRFVSIDQIVADGFSPFMSTTRLFKGDTYQDLIRHMGNFLSFRKNRWAKMLPLYDLYFNGKIELSHEHFLKLGTYYTVENELDACMALHQNTVLGFNHILPDDTLKLFQKYGNDIMLKLDIVKVYPFIQALGGKAYFQSVLKRLVKIYSRWIDDFEKHIPMVMVSLGDIKDKFNFETHGIATTSFEDMKSFYSDSYELMLEMIDIAVGLNNIAVRGDFNVFHTDTQATDFVAYRGKVKSERLKALIVNEPFSREISLNRHVRNAIAHYDYEFEPSSQKIAFNDKHKNKENTVEMYLSDLSLLCYDNIVILFYLSELMYTLRKVDYTVDGHFPNIGYPRKEE